MYSQGSSIEAFGPVRPHRYLIDSSSVNSPMQRLLQAIRKRHSLTRAKHLERKNSFVASSLEVDEDFGPGVRDTTQHGSRRFFQGNSNDLDASPRMTALSTRAFEMQSALIFIGAVVDELSSVMQEVTRGSKKNIS